MSEDMTRESDTAPIDGDTDLIEVLLDNHISVTLGDLTIAVSGCESFDDLEQRLFRLIDRLDERMNSKPPHHVDVA